MMENRKKTGLIIIGIAIVILAGIIFAWWKSRQSQVPAPSENAVSTSTLSSSESTGDIVPTTTPGDRIRNYQIYDTSKETPHQLDANDALKLSSSFAERLGSYSNQSDYDNFVDAKLFMTVKMQAWADKYSSDLRSKPYSGSFYGITTKSLTSSVGKYDEKAGTAEVLVKTQRVETKDAATKTFAQNLKLNLVKEGNEWKIDGAYWENNK